MQYGDNLTEIEDDYDIEQEQYLEDIRSKDERIVNKLLETNKDIEDIKEEREFDRLDELEEQSALEEERKFKSNNAHKRSEWAQNQLRMLKEIEKEKDDRAKLGLDY